MIFSYDEIQEAYYNHVAGSIEPTEMLMSPKTFEEMKRWLLASNYYTTEPLRWGNAVLGVNPYLKDGVIQFIGGAHYLKLADS